MWYVGVDGALTKSGFIALDGEDNDPHDEELFKTKHYKARPAYEKLHEIRVGFHRFVRGLLDYREDELVIAIEKSYMRASIKGYGKLQQVYGTLCLAAFDHGATILEVDHQITKKFAAGDDNHGKKPNLIEACYQIWNFERLEDDLVDAYALAQLARCVVLGTAGGYSQLQVDSVAGVSRGLVDGRV